jgi:predicted house-cleaning noncanonical NTP pyrophosphatase (MazG superfamily)
MSDANLKENIQLLTDEDFNKVGMIKGKSFNFKKDESKRKTYGVIAQEVLDAGNPEEVIDELGDVVEVMKSLIRAAKIRKFKIWKARMKKLKYRGGFKKGVYCKYVKYPVDITKKWMWKYPDITDQFVKNDK